MAKKSMIAREVKRQKLAQRYLEKRHALKEAIRTSDDFELIEQMQHKLDKLPYNSNPVRCNSRCEQCGRPRAIYKKFGLCRLCLRQQLMTGNVSGGRKSSW